MTEFKVDDVKGKKVVEETGNEVGTIEDVVFNPDTWRVDSLVINVRDEVADRLDLKRRAFSKAQLRVSPDRIAALGDYLTLNLSVEAMRDTLAPRGDKTTRR